LETEIKQIVSMLYSCVEVRKFVQSYNSLVLNLQLFLSATIPLENKEEVYVGWFFEANYHVPLYPQNLFSESESSRKSRGMDRRGTYVMLENVFEK
jgi:hypothetical protein